VARICAKLQSHAIATAAAYIFQVAPELRTKRKLAGCR
jgi:hypothetical protein